jgi:hypothetical protein
LGWGAVPKPICGVSVSMLSAKKMLFGGTQVEITRDAVHHPIA